MIMTLWGAVSAMVVAAARKQTAPRWIGFPAARRRRKHYSLADYLAAYTARADIANAMARFHE